MGNPKPRITRSRSGCVTCRRRHIKCDEAKPHCQTCRRLGIPCDGYPSAFVFRDDTSTVQRRAQRLSKRKRRVAAYAREPSPEHQQKSPRPDIDNAQSLVESNTDSSALESSRNIRLLSCRSGDTVGDTWLSQNFPANLPPIFREIWEGVGYSHPALKLALLAFAAVDNGNHPREFNYPKDAVELYSCALNAMAECMPNHLSNDSVTDGVVLLAILALLSMLEMSFGSFLGGITHCKQAHSMMEAYIQQLDSLEIGRRMICAWVPIKCWYSLQCAPWEDMSHPLPVRVRNALWDTLGSSADSSATLLALLCTARKLSMQLIFCRLVGTDVSSETYCSWSRQLQLIGNQAPKQEAFAAMSEQDAIVGLAIVRARLDQWHDQQEVSDMPTVKATSAPQQPQVSLPRSIQSGPLVFQSPRSASNYLRYLAAQALASTERLEQILSCKPGHKVQPDRWTCLALQTIAGLSGSLQEDDISVGLAWIVLNVILLRGPDPEILDCLENALPSLGRLADSRCALCPFWIIRDIVCKVREQSSRGRLVLHIESGIQASEELSMSRSNLDETQIMLLGYDVTEQAMFHTLG